MTRQSAVFGIPLDGVDAVWNEARPFLSMALAYDDNRFNVEDLYARVMDESMQLWVAYDEFSLHAAAVTEIIVFPNARVLRCAYAGGDNIEGALWFDQVLEQGAHEKQCSCIEIIGRRGWLKLLDGYKPTHTVMRKYI